VHDLCLSKSSKLVGPVGRKFASSYASNIEKYCGTGGSKIGQISKSELDQLSKYVREKVDASAGATGKQPLKNYSPWLAEFQAINFDEVCVLFNGTIFDLLAN
jgi:hypothetical protein